MNPNITQGYTEKVFLKILGTKMKLELNMVKLDNSCQTLFLFKEVSMYNKMASAKTTEKLQNLMLNSISHNLYTPINSLIQLNQNMILAIDGLNTHALRIMRMMGICLQQLVFTTHNLIEMSKIKIGKFKSNVQKIVLLDMVENIIDIFRDDMKYRQVDYDIEFDENLQTCHLKVDDQRLNILLYNLISNSIKNT